MKIIGVAGTNGSGKDTVSQVLAERHGYFVASATDMLDAELKRRGWPSDRQHKSRLGDEWRRQHGLGVIVDRAVKAAKAAGFDKLVVGSLRNPGEADRVHELGGKVVWVDADSKIRYERIQRGNRGRDEDSRSYAQFIAEEQAEMHGSGDAATLNMAAVKASADAYLENATESLAVFKDAAQAALKDFV